MAKKLHAFTINTEEKQSFTNLDWYLEEALQKSDVDNGIMIVYCPDTTGAITINENADPDVETDLKLGLNGTLPNKADYNHMERNSDGHMKASVIGANETLSNSEGSLVLGTLESIYFCEFDGPRTRTIYVKIMEG